MKDIPIVPYPEKYLPVCRNVEHWEELIIFGKCYVCKGEIIIRKSDIPQLARDIDHAQMEQDLLCINCEVGQKVAGELYCAKCLEAESKGEDESSQSEHEAYYLAH